MNPAIAAVFFDIGGVLEITPPTGWQARWEAELSLPAGAIDDRMHDVWRDGTVGAIAEADVHAELRRQLGLSADQLSRMLEDYWAEYLGTLDSALLNAFARLRPRFRTGIISNSFVGAREREQERYGFGDCCDTIVYSHEVGCAKPDARIFELACERLRVEPRSALLVDDVGGHLTAAARLGMRGLLHEETAQTIRELERMLG